MKKCGLAIIAAILSISLVVSLAMNFYPVGGCLPGQRLSDDNKKCVGMYFLSISQRISFHVAAVWITQALS